MLAYKTVVKIDFWPQKVTKLDFFLVLLLNVSVLWREEGYTMKYSLSPKEIPRDFLRAQAIFYCISRLESQYRSFQLQIQHWFPGRSILEELILQIAPTAGQYWKILPSGLSMTGEFNLNIIMFNENV